MIIVLLGPPGAGKGTQGELLAARLGIPKIATGDLFRAALREGTLLGLKAKSFMERGDLVPDDVILGILRDAIASPQSARGAILDGAVRTVPQAEGLKQNLASIGRKVDAVLLFEANHAELIRRLSSRTTCDVCQTPFKGIERGTSCPRGDGGRVDRRKDDEPEAIQNRLNVYEEQTAPVIAWYETHGVPVQRIDAIGDVAEVTARAATALEQVQSAG
ncbi:MAG: adenylate kinase [Gemmatimonadota bacterium]|nr:adenylate kinase [Gemmatimonadota bacterium]